jgi:tRNA(Ile)-lysidine synthase
MARGSGVDGLSGMAVRHARLDVVWLRPLLGIRRQSLRAFLTGRRIQWIDDPSNEDEGFERIKTRRALEVLTGLGIDAEVLARIAQNMAQAREALARQTFEAAQALVQVRAGGLCFDWPGLRSQPTEIRRRLLLDAIRWVSGAVYPPRRKALNAAFGAVQTDGRATLGGCLLFMNGAQLWVCRELNAVKDIRGPVDSLWDGRWRCIGPRAKDGYEIAALGPDGLAQCADWRTSGLPRALLLATPAIWEDGTLIAAPLVNGEKAWQAVLERGEDAFFAAVLSH